MMAFKGLVMMPKLVADADKVEEACKVSYHHGQKP